LHVPLVTQHTWKNTGGRSLSPSGLRRSLDPHTPGYRHVRHGMQAPVIPYKEAIKMPKLQEDHSLLIIDLNIKEEFLFTYNCSEIGKINLNVHRIPHYDYKKKASKRINSATKTKVQRNMRNDSN
jgi:hypothetical protein